MIPLLGGLLKGVEEVILELIHMLALPDKILFRPLRVSQGLLQLVAGNLQFRVDRLSIFVQCCLETPCFHDLFFEDLLLSRAALLLVCKL